MFSGIVTSAHFLTESANTPNGSAAAEIDIEPMIESVLAKPPNAKVPRAPAIALKPRPISSHERLAILTKASPNLSMLALADSKASPPITDMNPPRLPVSDDAVPNSARAPPIAVKPRAMSSHPNADSDVRADEISSRAWTVILMDAAPMIDPNPPKLPTADAAVPSSASAPPIPVSPLAIDSQLNDPSFFIFSEISSRVSTRILIDAAPRIELNPPNRPTIVAAPANSANAPPIALRPRPICSQLIEPSFLRFSEISSNVLDIIRIEVAPATEFNPENLCKITAAPTSSARAPPIAVRPR